MVPRQLCSGELAAAMAAQRPQTQHTPTHIQIMKFIFLQADKHPDEGEHHMISTKYMNQRHSTNRHTVE